MLLIKEWQGGTLDDVYVVVYRDAINFHVSSEGGIVKKAVYIALGIDMGGRRDILGCMWAKTRTLSSGL